MTFYSKFIKKGEVIVLLQGDFLEKRGDALVTGPLIFKKSPIMIQWIYIKMGKCHIKLYPSRILFLTSGAKKHEP